MRIQRISTFIKRRDVQLIAAQTVVHIVTPFGIPLGIGRIARFYYMKFKPSKLQKTAIAQPADDQPAISMQKLEAN